MVNVLAEIIAGKLIVWALYQDGQYVALATTVIQETPILRSKECFIFSLTSIYPDVVLNWKEGLRLIAVYAKSQGASIVTAITDFPAVTDRWERLGGHSSSFLSIHV